MAMVTPTSLNDQSLIQSLNQDSSSILDVIIWNLQVTVKILFYPIKKACVFPHMYLYFYHSREALPGAIPSSPCLQFWPRALVRTKAAIRHPWRS
jgi:hypothetical protein